MYKKVLGYKGYTSYETIQLSSLAVNEDNIHIIYWEDVVGKKWFVEGEGDCLLYIDGITRKSGNRIRSNSFVFKNKGNVYVKGAGPAKIRSIIFQNDGNAYIGYYTRPTKSGKSVRKSDNIHSRRFSFKETKILLRNTGNFDIVSDENGKVVLMMDSVIDSFNGGDINICSYGLHHATFYNSGKCTINSKGMVGDIMIKSAGDCSIESVECLNIDIRNDGNFVLKTPVLSGEKLRIRNNGHVVFRDILPRLQCNHLYVSNRGSFSIEGVSGIEYETYDVNAKKE